MTELDELSRTIGWIEQGIKDLNKKLDDKFDELPCGIHSKQIAESKAFENNLKGKIGIIAVVFTVVGGFALWIAQEIIRKFIIKS